ncbi:hypothetical protein [Brevundimonas sp. R86498]|uniref:hypothetical protein n=1 Tax=Brevundimonas sp. R86498 TaxID=3093845 RepID=UPI0037C57043
MTTKDQKTAPVSGPEREEDSNTPYARPSDRMQPDYDQLDARKKDGEDRQEALLDEAVEETFPASDPVSAKRIT